MSEETVVPPTSEVAFHRSPAWLGRASFSAAVLQLPYLPLVAFILIYFDADQYTSRIFMVLPSIAAIAFGLIALMVPGSDRGRAVLGIVLGLCFIVFGTAIAMYG